MTHNRKLLAILLTAVMVVMTLPSLLFSGAQAAAVGEVENGGFESGDFTGWTYNQWAVSVHSKSGCSDGNVRSGSNSARLGSHESVQGADALTQVVPVNTGATYTLSFYLKMSSSGTPPVCTVELGNTTTSFSSTKVVNLTAANKTSFTANSASFSTGSYKYARIRFAVGGSGAADSYLDDVTLTCTDAGDGSTHNYPTVTGYGTTKIRPSSGAKNTVTNGSFEATDGAPWNVSSFIKTNLSVVSDPTAPDGSKSLYYNNQTDTASWHTFTVPVEVGTQYVLSAWVKSPYLSSTNTGKGSIGIIHPDTGKFTVYDHEDYKYKTSSETMQIFSPANDNQWHLRSVVFHSSSCTSVTVGIYGVKSQMYVDDISVHKLSDGVTYEGARQTAKVTTASAGSNLYCAAEDNLIPDCHMNGAAADTFWTKVSSGWNNGFLSFDRTEDHGRVIRYGGKATRYYYIKWIPVEPNVDYTLSFDYKVETTGSGSIKLIDNNIELPVQFASVSFSSTKDWTTYSTNFNPGVHARIGIAVYDGGGAALLDNVRVFKRSDGTSVMPSEDITPTLKHTGGQTSRMEMEGDTLGLAFLFRLKTAGAAISKNYVGDLTAATVDATENGAAYPLVQLGAVVTNDPTVGDDPDAFVREGVRADGTVVDIPAKYLFEVSDTDVAYGIRVVNVPAYHLDTVVYCRPYYVFEYQGQQITVYGDVYYDTAAGIPDINDGWLEWD